MSEEEIDREIMKKYVKGGITFKPNLPIRKGLRGIRRKHTEPPFDNFVLWLILQSSPTSDIFL